jgi:hypothetical protein
MAAEATVGPLARHRAFHEKRRDIRRYPDFGFSFKWLVFSAGRAGAKEAAADGRG